jgi:hypothetical protein
LKYIGSSAVGHIQYEGETVGYCDGHTGSGWIDADVVYEVVKICRPMLGAIGIPADNSTVVATGNAKTGGEMVVNAGDG